jgi:hypothetical protein
MAVIAVIKKLSFLFLKRYAKLSTSQHAANCMKQCLFTVIFFLPSWSWNQNVCYRVLGFLLAVLAPDIVQILPH